MEEDKLKILFVGYEDPKHSSFGGYEQITKMPDTSFLDVKNLPFGFIPLGARGKKLNFISAYLFLRLIQSKYHIIHYFYFDYMMYKKMPKRSDTKFICTVHINCKEFSKKQIEILKSFDAVVSLSQQQKNELQKNGINAYFIPHGFNKPEFNFDELFANEIKKLDRINIFCSGNMYRDFETLKKVVCFCEEKGLNICFHCCGQKKFQKDWLLQHKNTIVYPFINDDKYFSLLTSCDYSFLPLTFATANNTLLEAQSFGIKTILPNIDGVSDYAEMEYNLFYNSMEELYVLFSNLTPNSTKSKEIEAFSHKFYWKGICTELQNLYRNLIFTERNCFSENHKEV